MSEFPKDQPADDTSELDPNSLAAIRDLIASADAPAPTPTAEPVAETQAAAMAPPEPKSARFSPLPPQSQTGIKRQKPVKPPKPPSTSMLGMMMDKLKAKVFGYRPKAGHIILACILLLVVFRPWLVLGLLFLSAFIFAGIFLVLGYDGFWRRVMGVARWYARKHPSRSVELHRKLDSFAMRFDAFLDRFPEGTVDGLYLPDFGDLAEAEARHDEALDRRLDNLRETEA